MTSLWIMPHDLMNQCIFVPMETTDFVLAGEMRGRLIINVPAYVSWIRGSPSAGSVCAVVKPLWRLHNPMRRFPFKQDLLLQNPCPSLAALANKGVSGVWDTHWRRQQLWNVRSPEDLSKSSVLWMRRGVQREVSHCLYIFYENNLKNFIP